MEDELTSLEGMKVSVPYSTDYSGTSYHNAVIFAVVSTEYEVQPIITIIIAFLRRRYFVAFLRQDKIFSILVFRLFPFVKIFIEILSIQQNVNIIIVREEMRCFFLC